MGEFEDKKGQIYELQIEAYDNEGDNPSQKTDETLKVNNYNRVTSLGPLYKRYDYRVIPLLYWVYYYYYYYYYSVTVCVGIYL